MYEVTKNMNKIITYPYPILSHTRFRLMSYNVGFCAGHLGLNGRTYEKNFIEDNLSRIINTIRKHRIDVLCAQEIDLHSRRSFYINQLDEIAHRCQFPFVYVSTTWKKAWIPYPSFWKIKEQFGTVHASQVIFSKFPIHTAETYLFEKPRRNSAIYNYFYINRLTQRATLIPMTGQYLDVFNIHFDAFQEAERYKQACETLSHLSLHPTLFCGDFNVSDSTGSGVSVFSEHPDLENCFGDQPCFSFPSTNPSKCFDRIFKTHQLSVENSYVITDDPISSDHCPLVLDLTLNVMKR